MSGSKNVILDSNIVIYLSQKKLSIDEIFEDGKRYNISLVTYMEILSYNFPSKEEENFIRKLLSLFRVIDINKTIAKEVIELKKKRKIKLHDAILYTNDKQLHSVEELEVRYFGYDCFFYNSF